jgi:hypothetical protein
LIIESSDEVDDERDDNVYGPPLGRASVEARGDGWLEEEQDDLGESAGLCVIKNGCG